MKNMGGNRNDGENISKKPGRDIKKRSWLQCRELIYHRVLFFRASWRLVERPFLGEMMLLMEDV